MTAEGLTAAATTTFVVPAAASLNSAASPLAKVEGVVGGISQLAVEPTFHVPFDVPDTCPFHCRAAIAEIFRKMVEPLSTRFAVYPEIGESV